MSRNRRSPIILTLTVALVSVSVAIAGLLWWRARGERGGLTAVEIDRLAQSEAMIVRAIDAEFQRWEGIASSGDELAGLPSDGTLLVFTPQGIASVRGERLAYYPAVTPPEFPPDDRLIQAEQAENARRDLNAALALYRDAASSTGRTVRAMATAGVGRCLRNLGRNTEALAAYADLATMVEATVDGAPAPLVAHAEREATFRSLGDAASADLERRSIAEALVARDRLIQKTAFDRFASALRPGEFPAPALARAEAVTTMWLEWKGMPSGRAIAGAREGASAAVWRRIGDQSHALVAPVDVLMAPARDVAGRLNVAISVEDAAGKTMWGTAPARTESITVPIPGTGESVKVRVALLRP